MFMIINLIESGMRRLIFNNLSSRVPQGVSGQLLFQTGFRKWLFGSLFPDSRFQNHPDTVILQKYHSLSNQNFKYNSAHVQSINLTLGLSFELRFLIFIINAYYTTLVVLGLLISIDYGVITFFQKLKD